ncbi:hypothetical protein HNP02_008534 [Mycobacterium sp. AZCC_0083]|nr:hypothetical protein [Mycobacterium sp. AZCC_0083]
MTAGRQVVATEHTDQPATAPASALDPQGN